MTKYIVKEIYLTDGQVKKLATAVAKKRQVSLKINPRDGVSHAQAGAWGTLTKLMLTKKQANKYEHKKTFVLNLSAAEIIAMAKHGGFFGPALSVMARTLIPKILPVLGKLGLAAASGAVSGATKKAVGGSGIKKIFV